VSAVYRSGSQLPQQLRGASSDQRGGIRDCTRYAAQVTRTTHFCLHRHRKRVHRTSDIFYCFLF